ncbi:MAG TPA: tyrosine-type recombinase/integrase [Candidatus Acidoferrales bacterium]|nr:tyrosine-type recombinase/integrase [Candidatus Acidoferrales bacterium]
MKTRYRLIRRGIRGGLYYCVDNKTGKRTSLGVSDEDAARQIIEARNNSERQPALNLQIARSYLIASDAGWMQRTWQDVMGQIQVHGKGSSKDRFRRALKCKAFDRLRPKRLLETSAEDFLAVLNDGRVSVAHYLRRIHNFAVGMGWLAVPVLAPRFWPKPQTKSKRAITPTEQGRILEAEKNPERNLFYQLLWEIGASQSDAAALTHENIDWPTQTLTYFRMKTGEQAQLVISKRLAAILNQLPTVGPLFPSLTKSNANSRAAEFCRRCRLLHIKGVSLHSYRYAWAERARCAGYPERFAQAALGHNSKAVHRAYAKRALVKIPSLEDYEERIIPMVTNRETPN